MAKVMHMFFIFCFFISYLNAVPGKVIGYDQKTQIPLVSLSSLNLENCTVLKKFNVEDLPKESNWHEHHEYYINRNRVVYCTADHEFVLKIWQKSYPSTSNFLSALYAGFYEEVALISGLIFDEEDECRGYISPYMIDRRLQRSQWESYGFVLEKGRIGVNIFSAYELQPHIYRDLFDKLINNTKRTGYFTIDFCPSNIAVNDKDKKAYLIDLEDIQTAETINDQIIAGIFLNYSANDFIEKITGLMK